jgi:uncharacterized protein YegL
MTRDSIKAVNSVIRSLQDELMTDPLALETWYVSIITFDREASQIIPLTELGQFQPPTLQAAAHTDDPTALGGALRLLERCLDTEVRRASPTKRGDYRPTIFLMTDGAPTDSWEDAADRIKARKVGNIIACAAGKDARVDVLKRISDTVVHLADFPPDFWRSIWAHWCSLHDSDDSVDD